MFIDFDTNSYGSRERFNIWRCEWYIYIKNKKIRCKINIGKLRYLDFIENDYWNVKIEKLLTIYHTDNNEYFIILIVSVNLNMIYYNL